jgi:hypothetical protein
MELIILEAQENVCSIDTQLRCRGEGEGYLKCRWTYAHFLQKENSRVQSEPLNRRIHTSYNVQNLFYDK